MRSLPTRIAVRSGGARALLAICAAGLLGIGATSAAAAQDPAWNQVDNIKDAALRLAQIQRTQGATKAFTFIDACYRTHSLSSEYTKAFEACIVQDYLETQILALVYSRVDPESLKRMGAPSPDMLAQTMTRRVGAAFAQYKVSKERIAEFKRNMDEHGFPLFFKTLFPDAQLPERPNPDSPPPQGTQEPEKK
jgi:hypothetical protein